MTTRPIPPRIRAEEIIRRLTEALPRPEVNRDQLQRALDDMQAALPNLDRAVKDMEPPDGLRAASYEARVSGGGSEQFSIPERLAFTDTDQADRDLLERDLRTMEKWCNSPCSREHVIGDAAYSLLLNVRKHSPRAPSSKDLREVSAANTAATECALTREHLGVWEQVHRTSDLWGMLPDPAPVGRWVWDFARTRRRLPTPQEWRTHGSNTDRLRVQMLGKVPVKC